MRVKDPGELELPIDRDPVDDAFRLIIQASNSARIKVEGITDSEIREAREMACQSIEEANFGMVDL